MWHLIWIALCGIADLMFMSLPWLIWIGFFISVMIIGIKCKR